MPVILPGAQWKWRREDRGSARSRMLPPHAYTGQCKRPFKIPEIRDDACEMRSVAPSTLATNNRITTVCRVTRDLVTKPTKTNGSRHLGRRGRRSLGHGSISRSRSDVFLLFAAVGGGLAKLLDPLAFHPHLVGLSEAPAAQGHHLAQDGVPMAFGEGIGDVLGPWQPTDPGVV